jgi:hypothetical protein
MEDGADTSMRRVVRNGQRDGHPVTVDTER